MTRGLGILTSVFDHYEPFKGTIVGRRQGVLIANAAGRTTPYASFQLQERGTLFVAPNDDVYEGMIVGENSRGKRSFGQYHPRKTAHQRSCCRQ